MKVVLKYSAEIGVNRGVTQGIFLWQLSFLSYANDFYGKIEGDFDIVRFVDIYLCKPKKNESFLKDRYILERKLTHIECG